MPIDSWRQVVGRAVQDAQAGDAKARDWLTRYLIGDPAEIADLSDVDSTDHNDSTESRRAEILRIMECIRERSLEVCNPDSPAS